MTQLQMNTHHPDVNMVVPDLSSHDSVSVGRFDLYLKKTKGTNLERKIQKAIEIHTVSLPSSAAVVG